MTKGNPYTDPERGMLTDGLNKGWEEGYHSRDEVVAELQAACEAAYHYLDEFDRLVAIGIAARLGKAIAKAKGTD